MTRELKSYASKLCKHLECHNMIGVVLIAMTVTCTLRIFLSLLKFPIHGCSLPTWTLSKACFHKVGSWKKAENREEKGNGITIVKKWGATPHARGKDEDRANRIKRKKTVDDGARGKRRWYLTCLRSSMSTLFPAIASTMLGGPNWRSSCIQLCISVKLLWTTEKWVSWRARRNKENKPKKEKETNKESCGKSFQRR